MAAQWEDMEEHFFSCSICLDNFKDPKLLPCLHRFCRCCIKPTVDTATDKVTCPLCKQECDKPEDGVDGFKTDFHTNNIIEYIQLRKSVKDEEVRECVGCSNEVKVAAFCFKCRGFLCHNCHGLHENSRMLKDHMKHVLALKDIDPKNLTIEKLGELKEAPLCSEHPEKLAEICCVDCGVIPICMVCGQYEKHKGHTIRGIGELAGEERMKVESTLKTLNEQDDNVRSLPQRLEKGKQALKDKIAAEKDRIRSQYDKEMEKIKIEEDESNEALALFNAEVEREGDVAVADLNNKRESELREVNDKYDTLVSGVKTDVLQKQGMATELKTKTMLSCVRNSLEKELAESLASLNLQGDGNLNTFEELSDQSTHRIQQYDNFMSVVSSILASRDDWADVRCLPTINASSQPLVEDSMKTFPEVASLSSVTSKDLTPVLAEQKDDVLEENGNSNFVRDNIKVGMAVRCCKSFYAVKEGDTGTVTKLDEDDPRKFNVEVYWKNLESTHWLKYHNVELLGIKREITVGCTVRVKRSISIPKYTWGSSVKKGDTGIVVAIPGNDDCTVNFPTNPNWRGLLSEMEVVP